MANKCINFSSPGPENIKLFQFSTQLSINFQLLIKSKIVKNMDFSSLQTLKCCIYDANKTFFGILTFMSMINFMLS